MALIDKWPQEIEEFYDNKQWEAKNWSIGEPITKEKLQKMDDGIAILATQVKAILGEFNPSSLDDAQLNASRLDIIQKWITALENGTYDLTKGSIAARLDSIATEVWDSNTTTGTSRIDKNDNKIAAIANELGGGTPDGTSTTYPTAATRLDDLEKEIGGTRSAGNGYTNSRITALENELSGSGTGISGSSRLDNLQTWIAGASTSTYNGAAIATRLEDIDTLDSQQNGRLDTQGSNIDKIKNEVWGENKDYSDISRIGDLDERTGAVESLSSSNESRIGEAESRIERIEGGAIAAKILNYTTTNTSASDNLILPTNSLLDKNSIIMIFLNAATLGTNNLTIRDSTNVEYSIKINNSNLKAKFAAGSLLGIYRGNTNDIYMFNAPLAI